LQVDTVDPLLDTVGGSTKDKTENLSFRRAEGSQDEVGPLARTESFGAVALGSDRSLDFSFATTQSILFSFFVY